MNRNDCGSLHVPAARIVLANNSTPTRRSEIRCTIGRDLIIRPEVLGQYCMKPLDPRIYDLVLIAGAVAFADRVVPRRIGICWRRELEVVRIEILERHVAEQLDDARSGAGAGHVWVSIHGVAGTDFVSRRG